MRFADRARRRPAPRRALVRRARPRAAARRPRDPAGRRDRRRRGRAGARRAARCRRAAQARRPGQPRARHRRRRAGCPVRRPVDGRRRSRVPDEYLEREVAAQEAEIARREETLPRADVRASSSRVAVGDRRRRRDRDRRRRRSRRSGGRARHEPIASSSRSRSRRGQSLGALEREADAVIALATPEPFLAVGEWYENFEQTTDDEVLAALGDAAGHAA